MNESMGMGTEVSGKTVRLLAAYLTGVLDVRVCNESRPGKGFFIHGKISVTTLPFDDSVTIFDRSGTDPDYIITGDPLYNQLSLVEDPSTDRPLIDTSQISIQMELYARDADNPQAQSLLILRVGPLLYVHYPASLCNETGIINLKGQEGFNVRLNYVAINGTRVKVSLKFIKPLESESESGEEMSFYGTINVSLRLAKPKSAHRECADMRLLFRNSENPVKVAVGQTIPLDRTVTVAPVGRSLLCIAFELFAPNTNKLIAKDVVRFFFPLLDNGFFTTNEHGIHTKEAANDLISVTIQLCDEEDGDPCDMNPYGTWDDLELALLNEDPEDKEEDDEG